MVANVPYHKFKDTTAVSNREREVAALIIEGLSNKQIAQTLGLGEETIRSHLRMVYAKTGLRRGSLWKLFHGN